MSSVDHNHFKWAGGLIALGIIFGDIGTSPLYVMRAIVGDREITEALMLGGMSCVFWTLTLVTTFKYVYLALNNDNNGEGGIFALYALVRKGRTKWVIIPAIIGCATLIADGFITPAISISSAIEGLQLLNPSIPTLPIILLILIGLFSIQQFGTKLVGNAFGPIMFTWFSMLAILGIKELVKDPGVLAALNPMYAFNLLINYPQGFWLLGAVFLCTTGAEALYSDLGHVGRKNIRVTWLFVKICLLLNYFGQTAYILNLPGKTLADGRVVKLLGEGRPFYDIMPEWFLPFGIGIATLATIIASQALITGVFTIVNEGIKLRVWPETRVKYPTIYRGQIYIPAINWILLIGCMAVVLIFRKSENMEAAYGLAITIDMIMTSTLMIVLMSRKPNSFLPIIGFASVFLPIELAFFISNSSKFGHGGWFSFMIAAGFFLLMYILHQARNIRAKAVKFEDFRKYIDLLREVQQDQTIAKDADNLVYMSVSSDKNYIDSSIIYSLFRKRPRRADTYWFVHIETLDEPFTADYSVEAIIPGKCFFIKLRLGFKVEHKVNLMFKKIVQEMADRKEIDLVSPHPSMNKYQQPADFKFVLINGKVSANVSMSPLNQFILSGYHIIKKFSLPKDADFGLETANVEWENVPLQITRDPHIELTRTK